MSSNCSVENNALVMSPTFLLSTLSPTLTGITLKILPVETLWSPTILMSLITNSSNADEMFIKPMDKMIKNNFFNFIP